MGFKKNLNPRRKAAGRDKVVVKRSRRGATKSYAVIYRDSDVDNDEGEDGGKAGRAKAKDYDGNNGVEDNGDKSPLASIYGDMDAFAKKRETPQRGDNDNDNDNVAGNTKNMPL